MKKQTLLLVLSSILFPLLSFGTGLSFQTLAPTAGEILTSGGEVIVAPQSADFGTLSGNLDLSDTGSFTSFTDYSGIFSSLTTVSFNSSGDLLASTGDNAPGYGQGTNVWLLIDTGVEQGAFYLGSTPELGVLTSTPTLAGGPGWGSSSGGNLLLQPVPEPSSFALLSGLLALGWVATRRRA
jgi:hypothetical protein